MDEDYYNMVAILDKINEMEEKMANLHRHGISLEYEPEDNIKEATRIYNERTEEKMNKKVEKMLWMKLHS